jgi:hypothetical protein
MAVDRTRHARIVLTLPHSLRRAIRAYATRSGAPSEAAAIRDLIALGLAAAVNAEVRASIGTGIASPKPRPRDPA